MRPGRSYWWSRRRPGDALYVRPKQAATGKQVAYWAGGNWTWIEQATEKKSTGNPHQRGGTETPAQESKRIEAWHRQRNQLSRGISKYNAQTKNRSRPRNRDYHVKTGADGGKTRNLSMRKQKLDRDSGAENEQNNTGSTKQNPKLAKSPRKTGNHKNQILH
jgi:hypothetical protein